MVKSSISAPKIALAGCGYWGKNLARVLAEKGVLGAIVDPAPEAAALANKYGVLHLNDLGAVLTRADFTACVIATPAETHYQLARDALWAGKDVFVEKPIALETMDAEELAALAAARGRVLMVGHLLQYHPAFLRLKQMVDNGDIGQLRYVYSNRLNMGKLRREENVLWSFAPHDLSMILALAGEMPDRVWATGQAFLNKRIADTTMTHLEFRSGLNCHIYVSWLHPIKEQRLVVIGDRGMLLFDDAQAWQEKLMHYPHAVAWKDGMPVATKADGLPVALHETEPLGAEIDHFLHCLTMRATPRTDAPEAIRVLRVLNAAQASMESGEAVQLAGKPLRAPASTYFIHETAVIDDNVTIGAGTKIWHFSHILGNSHIGENCVFGQNCSVGPDVVIGNGCKFQNNVSVFRGVTLEDDVFCGPSMVFTNVLTPRAHIERKDEFSKTLVRRGASIGANATIICGNEIGAYAMIAAGAIVTRDVPAHALMIGAPARRVGWVSRSGERLGTDLKCPRTGEQYVETADGLHLLQAPGTSQSVAAQ